MDNICNVMICTQHQDSLIVESSDRRYAVFATNSKYIGDEEFFTRTRRLAYNQVVGDAFLTHCKEYDKKVSLRKIPETETRRELKEASMDNPLRFLREIKEQFDEKCLGDFGYEGDQYTGIVTGKALYDKYIQWIHENGEKYPRTNSKFGRTIKGSIEKKKSHGVMKYDIGSIRELTATTQLHSRPTLPKTSPNPPQHANGTTLSFWYALSTYSILCYYIIIILNTWVGEG